jgi:hypothetical protein
VTRKLFVVVAVLGLTSIVAVGQSKPDLKMLTGTWKLNVEKSKYTPGPGPKSQTLTWKRTATGFDFTVDTVIAEGKATQQRASGNLRRVLAGNGLGEFTKLIVGVMCESRMGSQHRTEAA